MSDQQSPLADDEIIPVPVGEQAPKQAPESAEVSGDNPQDLVLAALAIFDTGSTRFTIRAGQSDEFEVVIKQAKMGQMPAIMRFFHNIAESLDQSQLKTLIDTIAAKQRILIEQGIDPRTVDVQELASEDVVSGAFNNASILSLMFAATFEFLPGFATLFTNVDEERFKDLDFDEGVMLIMGIFIVNYGFFTQRLRPILTGFVRSIASASKGHKTGPLVTKIQRK